MNEHNHFMKREREILLQQKREDRVTLIIAIAFAAILIIGGIV